ncbi:hypothetical protein TELCIR_05236 [Teladorsagia circumcincta]|uniref:Uncharacterized protein n=1 Tax=Teladorsagia circumcincta TaxID=45464 RepID=A0A2G9URM9_TELCI|nr:hypothetical protein TELCIR_05236 [Teladorsagia circumcincta]
MLRNKNNFGYVVRHFTAASYWNSTWLRTEFQGENKEIRKHKLISRGPIERYLFSYLCRKSSNLKETVAIEATAKKIRKITQMLPEKMSTGAKWQCTIASRDLQPHEGMNYRHEAVPMTEYMARFDLLGQRTSVNVTASPIFVDLVREVHRVVIWMGLIEINDNIQKQKVASLNRMADSITAELALREGGESERKNFLRFVIMHLCPTLRALEP